jgi:signal transduction histidine kinase
VQRWARTWRAPSPCRRISGDPTRSTVLWAATRSHGSSGPQKVTNIAQDADYEATLDELTRLNNELVEAQRELQRRKAELDRASTRMNELLGMTAHDLRGPIGSIGSLAQTLHHRAADRLDDTEKMVLERIHHSSERMLTMVEDLLSLSEVDRGGLALDRQPCDLVEVVRSAVGLAQVVASEKDVHIEATLPSEPVGIVADDTKLEQVVGNLLSNATKYSHRGSVVEVELSADDEVAVLRVTDHGVGIPAEELDRIFAPFTKISSQPTEGESSTGLGLAIVQRIVRGHNGRVEVSSTVDAGTTMTVFLPRGADGESVPADT